jgi:hypothetical protein
MYLWLFGERAPFLRIVIKAKMAHFSKDYPVPQMKCAICIAFGIVFHIIPVSREQKRGAASHDSRNHFETAPFDFI